MGDEPLPRVPDDVDVVEPPPVLATDAGPAPDQIKEDQ
jgi:hypothetical protein